MELKEGSTYRHYKGDLYRVIKIAYTTEGKELKKAADIDDSVKLVVYKALEHNTALGNDVWWVRPYITFTGSVIVDGKEQPRFVEHKNDEDECSLCIASPRAAAYVKQMNGSKEKKKQKSEIPLPF